MDILRELQAFPTVRSGLISPGSTPGAHNGDKCSPAGLVIGREPGGGPAPTNRRILQ